jgi:hypothetical protein
MSPNRVLLKGHRHRTLGIAGLSSAKRLMAALPRMQGEGLQRQTAEQEQCRSGERQGQGKPPLLWIMQSHPRATNTG